MNAHTDKTHENKNYAVEDFKFKKKNNGESAFRLSDNRAQAIAQRKLQEIAGDSPQVAQLRRIQNIANKSPQAKQAAKLQTIADNYTARQRQPVQKKENNTGLPDNLKSGIENLSGYCMDDVKVHYNSDKPAQLQAHAYAQGTDIHLAPGQEKHLSHEVWHVVQQKQGRVKPTLQMKMNVNDNGLEKEADVMGARALMMRQKLIGSKVRPVVQRNNRSENEKQPLQRVAWNEVWTQAMDEEGRGVLTETLGEEDNTDNISGDELRELREYLVNRVKKIPALSDARDAIEQAFAEKMKGRAEYLTSEALKRENIPRWEGNIDKIIGWILGVVEKEETETFEQVFTENRMTLRQVNEAGDKPDILDMALYHVNDKAKEGVRKNELYGRGVASNDQRMNPDNFLDDAESGPPERNARGLHEVGATLLDGSRSIEKQMKPYREASQIFMPVPSEHDHQVLSGLEGLPDKREDILNIIRAFTTRITKAQASDMATGHVYTSDSVATGENVTVEYGLTGKAPVNSKYDIIMARKVTEADIQERRTRALEYTRTLETLKNLRGKEVAMQHRLHGGSIFPIYTRWQGEGEGFKIYSSKDGSLDSKVVSDEGNIDG